MGLFSAVHLPYYSPLLNGLRYTAKVQKGWDRACFASKLYVQGRSLTKRYTPTVSDFRLENEHGDAVSFHVNLEPTGFTTLQLERASEVIASALGAHRARVEKLTAGRARVTIEYNTQRSSFNPYANALEDGAFDVSNLYIDLDKAQTGHALLSASTSLLVGGQSGAGKSNIIWLLLSCLNDYQVPYRLTVIDPTGVELADLENSPNTHTYVDRAAHIDDAVRDFHQRMLDRFTKMKRDRTRQHIPTPQEPMEILVIDELLLCKSQLQAGALSPIGEVLAAGRKGCYLVWGCSQLNQKDVIGQIRDLFVQRICLSVKTQEATDAVLGSNATADGANCHRIPNRSGIGYVWTEAFSSYEKFAAPYVQETMSVAMGGVTAPPDPRTRRGRTKEHAGTTFVYKLYDDPDTSNPRPCYIGISNNPRRRFKEHAKNEVWWDSIVMSRTEIQKYPTWDRADQMETDLIDYYAPKYNVAKRTD